MPAKTNAADEYQILSDIEHVLHRPDTYIGSSQIIEDNIFICDIDSSTTKIIKKHISYCQGLERIYEEILLNAFDHTVREGTGCNEISVDIDQPSGTITVMNNGQGIPVVMKDEMKCYIPEMLFGHLRSGSNFKDGEDRLTGGRNGLGSSLANIFSTEFTLETIDSERKKHYVQSWSDHMDKKTEPIIKTTRKKPMTRVSFKPDLKYFKLESLSDDIVMLMKKRLIDIGFASHAGVKTYYNGTLITIKKPEDYMKLYSHPEGVKFIVDSTCERWTVGVALSNEGFQHAAFANGIHTSLGGSHVDHVSNQVAKEIIDKLKSKKITVKPSDVKNKIFVFIKSAIVNPVFDSQSKECLKMAKAKFGSEFIMSDAFRKKLLASDIFKSMTEVSDTKKMKDLSKTSGVKTSRLTDMDTLEDAAWAGTAKGLKARLILTEGLSARTFAISALNVIGREKYGVFPLKGKLLNVRNVSIERVSANEEIRNIVKILGLKYDLTYETLADMNTLRYGGVVCLTDADSVSGDTPLLIRNNGMMSIVNIEDLTNQFNITANGKEYSDLDGYEIWTDSQWTKINQVMRHKVSKKMYRVLTHTGCVDVTEDHSLIRENGQEVAPKDCMIGDTLLHSYPNFEDSLIDIPENFRELNGKMLWPIASRMGIQYYQQLKKTELIEKIEEYMSNYQAPTRSMIHALFDEDVSRIDYITVEEAFVIGFFAADGSCKTYSWETTVKNKNRPNPCTYVRTNHSWHLDNCNLELLNKCQNILAGIYGDVFNLVKIQRGPMSVNDIYRLILNGGMKTKYIIDKYRMLCYYKDYKYIHPLILNNTRPIRSAFFDGYYAGDGIHDLTKPMRCDVNGKILAHSLYHLAKSLGYRVSLNCNTRKPKVFSMIFNRSNSCRINNSIKKIIELPHLEQYVYDLETANHHFHAGIGEMIVHNTDGVHICGLIINYFHTFWPKILEKGFLSFCITPIVKVFKGKQVLQFYTLNKYEEWLKTATGQFKTKYFKGLGTSTAAEAREALKDIDQKLITFERDESCDEKVSLAFNGKRADDRKEWLMERYDPESSIDRNQRLVSVSDFIDYELSHFSTYDCARSIPNVLDGLKPSQRKIMHVALKHLTKNEMKVGQLGPLVSQLTDYHHGEQSLMGAIIGMAQDYVSSNNINLLLPLGGFGTRLASGNDAASPRYIFTKLNPVAMKLFDTRDSTLLKYIESDGSPIEPEWFAPVLPMILINGTLGIGTGFSTSVLQYNPKDIIKYIKAMLKGDKPEKTLMPWYRGFTGNIVKDAANKYTTFAVWKFDDSKRCLQLTDLPINVWTDNYKSFCEKLLAQDGSPLSDVIYGNTDTIVDIKFIFKPSEYEKYKSMNHDDLVKEFKLSSKLSSTNMYLFNAEGRIERFSNVYSIIKYYFLKRLDLYVKRKEALIQQLKYEILILRNKAKFINAVKQGDIDQRSMTEDTLLKALQKSFDADPRSTAQGLGSYEYLISMTYRSFTNENAQKMNKHVKEKEAEMKALEATTPEQMWDVDLDDIAKML